MNQNIFDQQNNIYQETNQNPQFENYINNKNYILNNNQHPNMNGNAYYKAYLHKVINQMNQLSQMNNIKNQQLPHSIMHNQMQHQVNNQLNYQQNKLLNNPMYQQMNINNQLNNQVQLQILSQMMNQKKISEYNQNNLNNYQQYIQQCKNYQIQNEILNSQNNQNPMQNLNMNNNYIQQCNIANNLNYQNQINQQNYMNSLILNQIETTKQSSTKQLQLQNPQQQQPQQNIIDINQIDDIEPPKEQMTLFLPGEIYSKKSVKKYFLQSPNLFKLMHNGTSLTKRPNIMINKSINKLSPYNSLDKIYIPNLNDFVIGMIIQKNTDNYKLEINSLLPGVLEKDKHDSNKRTKEFEHGDLILCRVISTNRNDYYQLSIEETKKPKDIKIDADLGKLVKGTVFDIPLNKIKLLNKDFAEFKNTRFSFTVGQNGKIFIMPNLSFIYKEIPPLYKQILQKLQVKYEN